MIISVKDVETDTPVNTVLLFPNRQKAHNVFLFRCYKCGTAINQVQGFIGAIYAGYIPSPEVATINQCHTCQERYTFQTHFKKSTDTKLILSSDSVVTTFHCVICRLPLVQYNTKGAALLPDFKPVLAPVAFPCFSPVCQASYFLKEIVEKVV